MRLRSERRRKAASFNWTLWLKWVLVSTLGWLIGWALTHQLAVGAIVGVMQWLVLRPLIRRDIWWVPVSAAGWAAGVALVTFVLQPDNEVVGPVVIGIGIGLAQWVVLRRQLPRAWWWIVLSMLGWTLGLFGVVGRSLVGGVAGAVTGLALESLLRHASPSERTEET